MTLIVLLQWALGVCVFLVGRWGRRKASVLVDVNLDPEDRTNRVGVLRRGAVACHLLAILFFATTIPAVVVILSGPCKY